MLERDSVYNSVLDRIDRLEAQIEDLRDVARPGEVITVEQPEWQALAGWVSTGTVLRDVTGKIVLDPTIPRIRIGAGGYIESEDFVAGVSGFQINGGTAEFNDVVVRGTIYATLGAIGGWIIGTHTLTADSGAVGLNSEATVGVDWRIWAGHATPGSAPFRVDESGNLVASSANITGTIDANAGHLGSLDVDGVITVGAVAPYIEIDGVNKRIQSSTFSAGLAGMRIDANGDAEFNNVTVRGALASTVFVRDLVDARAGTLVVVKSAGVLAEDMAVPGAGTWDMYVADPPGGGFLFANGDICRCKSEYSGGIADIWFTVASRTDMGDGTQRYTCTYQSGTRSVTYPAGGPVLDYGISGDGGVLQTADQANAPYLSIFTHAGAPWTTVTERLRLGNLAGWQGAGLTGYGIAIGDYSGNEFAYYTPGTGLVIRGTIRADDGYLATLSVTGTLTLSGSGKLITAASPAARIELSTTELAGYSDATTKQFYISATDGKAYAGGGVVILDEDGIWIESGSAFYDNANSIKFFDGTTTYAALSAWYGLTIDYAGLKVEADTGKNGAIEILARGNSTSERGTIALQAKAGADIGGVARTLTIYSDAFAYLDTGLRTASSIYVNETANANMTVGITINQGANDDEAFALKSSDVAHGMTDVVETDTYAVLKKLNADDGGLLLDGLAEGTRGLMLRGSGVTDNTTKSTSGNAYVHIRSQKKSGSTVSTAGTDANLVVIQNFSVTKFIFDAEGSAHADVEWTTFDEHDDVALLGRLEQTAMTREFGGWADTNRAELERLGIAHFDDVPGHAMVNWTKLSMLLVGALRQTGQRIATLEQKLLEA